MKRKSRWSIVLLGALALLAACSSSDDDGGSAPTAAPTATRPATSVPTIPATSTATRPAATATPTTPSQATATGAPQTATPAGGASVAGLAVVRGDLRAGEGDALAAPPAEWSGGPDGGTFDRALSYATWRVFGPVEREGTTGADGSFSISDLPPGSYRLHLERTLNGDLLNAIVPFLVGADGTAEIVVEIAQGLVRATNTYRDGETTVRAVTGPSGNSLVTRDGAIVALGGSGRSYEDADGDGVFDPTGCNGSPRPWTCAADGDCGADHVCSCASSCPFCDDCLIGVCLPKGSPSQPYACGGERACVNPGESCACVSSCPDCEDCPASVCVSSCIPAEIDSISISGPTTLYLGRGGAMTAVAILTDGGAVDVTQLVTWASSDESTASVDSWGTLTAHAVGSAAISATLGELTSEPWTVVVAERPGLLRIHLQNLWCAVPFGKPEVGPDGTTPQPGRDQSIPPPTCRQVVRVGGTLHLFALGEFDDGYYEDITSQVTWTLTPPDIGQVEAGVFTGLAAGSAELTASLGGVVSDALELRVVDQPTVLALQIYPLAAVPRPGPLPPISGDAAFPCYDCGFVLTLLRGDELPFQAVASYDTGEWEDVTARVTWSTSDAGVAAISTAGVVTAVEGGEASISATLGEVSSNPVGLRVVNQATLLSLSIYREGYDTVVEKGGEALFKAFGYYDVGFDRDVTDSVVWKSSSEAVGGFTAPGIFLGRSAGTAQVSAELGSVQSNTVPIEVFESSTLSYCDENAINRVEWSDAFNRVVLDSDCGVYEHPDVATLRFTVTERERPGGIFDPCLDLYVYQGTRLVRTIREEGCGQPFLAPGAEFDEAKLRYQTLAFWDLRDDRGSPVPPGAYTIRGRFYLYYDPIVDLPVVVTAPDGGIPCVDNACGNGCGYVHACGDEGPPLSCPEVCTALCECPAGWGITDDGDCEPCTEECCPQGAACLPGTPTCEPPPVCCPPDQVCIPELPPCGSRCCPLGALCGPLDLPPCDCCPDGAQCEGGGIVPCGPPPPCCPRDAICILPLPTCPPGDCCPPGATCADDIVPCEDVICCKADGSCDPLSAPCP